MAGIAGVFGTGFIESGPVQSMAGMLGHRGEAELMRTSYSVVAGLRRPRAGSGSAVMYTDGDLAVVFDGDLLNSAELTAVTNGDAAWPTPRLLAHAYRQFGPAFVEKIEGPFALAIVDGNRISLARDAVGVRPLYIRQWGDALLFASEAKALMGGASTISIDMDTLLERYVFSDHAVGTSTLFREVHSLAPGSYAVGRAEDSVVDLIPTKCDTALATSGIVDAAALRAEIRAIVEQNVRRIVERYHRVGVLLSGGFDSSVLACLAQRYAGSRVRTFTIGDSEVFPDVQAARQVASHLGTEHYELLVDTAPDPDDLVRGIHAYEDLSYRDTLFILARRAAGLADVALSGSGADLLGIPVLLRRGRLARVMDNWRRLSGFLRDPDQRRIASYMDAFVRELELDREAAVLRHFLDDYIPNQLIPSTERAINYWGMDAAFPFADRRLMGVARQVKTAPERTRLLREAFADLDLPANIKERPKLCSKHGLLEAKSIVRESRPGSRSSPASAAAATRLGGLLRSDFEVRCYELLESIFIRHRGTLPPDVSMEAHNR